MHTQIIVKKTLGKLKMEYPELLIEIANKIRPYTTLVIYNQSNDLNPNGSGTFINCGISQGLLMNDHVWENINDKNHIYIPEPYPATGLLELKVINHISLPSKATMGWGIDLAYVILDKTACDRVEKIGKKFWNFSKSAAHYKNGLLQLDSKSVHNYLWMVQGGPFEGRFIQLDKDGKSYWHYPNACDDFLGPSLIEPVKYTSYKQLGNEQFPLDRIKCFINRTTSSNLPSSFNGISGAGVFRIELFDFKIIDVQLAGVATEEEANDEKINDFFIFHGPVSLYDSLASLIYKNN